MDTCTSLLLQLNNRDFCYGCAPIIMAYWQTWEIPSAFLHRDIYVHAADTRSGLKLCTVKRMTYQWKCNNVFSLIDCKRVHRLGVHRIHGILPFNTTSSVQFMSNEEIMELALRFISIHQIDLTASHCTQLHSQVHWNYLYEHRSRFCHPMSLHPDTHEYSLKQSMWGGLSLVTWSLIWN